VSQQTYTRFVALIDPIAGERQATHTAGYPLDPAKMLPPADVVLVVAGSEAGVMLFRYTAGGEFGGDTWHATAAEAWNQATEEYGDALGAWVAVPAEVADAHAYAVQYAAERPKARGDQ
jgi:hypothetical protein